ncbi:TRAP transporter substrate-binding protein [Oscillibacter sp.]|uniref:TRAP transporter substrate-binding protein n=1 Tax=Oscillibacter sp. TaxID=1945593 RepID=UPI0028982857|nr:TRAP transporter substrate-binding protein [Oscillibacter sp.]
MKMKKLSALLMALLSVSTLLAGCGGSSQSSQGSQAGGETYKIQLAGSVAEEHPITQGLYKFEELAEKYSDGRIEVDVYPNGQLGSNREYYEQCQQGNIQMAEGGAVVLANFTDSFKFMQLPYLFNSRESIQNFLNSEDGKALTKKIAEESGIYPLAFFENGWQALTNSVREVKTPADLKGLKIRTQENDILLKVYTDMGGNPMPMAFSELFTAMQQKTVDGQVNPALIASTGNYDEVQKYITDVAAVYDATAISINYDFYQSLPAELQAVVDQAAQEATQYQLKLSAEGEEGAYQELSDGGMTVTRLTDEEREAFKATTTGVYDWFRQQGTEPNLDTYMEKIQVCNDKFTNGELEAITGVEK